MSKQIFSGLYYEDLKCNASKENAYLLFKEIQHYNKELIQFGYSAKQMLVCIFVENSKSSK